LDEERGGGVSEHPLGLELSSRAQLSPLGLLLQL